MRLEDVISTEEILELKNLHMKVFERKIWNALGSKFIKEEDRQKVSVCLYQGKFIEK